MRRFFRAFQCGVNAAVILDAGTAWVPTGVQAPTNPAFDPPWFRRAGVEVIPPYARPSSF